MARDFSQESIFIEWLDARPSFSQERLRKRHKGLEISDFAHPFLILHGHGAITLLITSLVSHIMEEAGVLQRMQLSREEIVAKRNYAIPSGRVRACLLMTKIFVSFAIIILTTLKFHDPPARPTLLVATHFASILKLSLAEINWRRRSVEARSCLVRQDLTARFDLVSKNRSSGRYN
jgi:hypothetical protein